MSDGTEWLKGRKPKSNSRPRFAFRSIPTQSELTESQREVYESAKASLMRNMVMSPPSHFSGELDSTVNADGARLRVMAANGEYRVTVDFTDQNIRAKHDARTVKRHEAVGRSAGLTPVPPKHVRADIRAAMSEPKPDDGSYVSVHGRFVKRSQYIDGLRRSGSDQARRTLFELGEM